MATNLRKRGKKWYGKVKVNGQWKEKSLSEDKKTAQRMLREIQRSLELESVDLPVFLQGVNNLEKLKNHYLKSLEARSKTNASFQSAKNNINLCIRELGAKTVQDVTLTRLTDVIDGWLRNGIGKQTINTRVWRFRGMFKRLLKEGLIPTNPISDFKGFSIKPKDTKRDRYALTKVEAKRLVETVRHRDTKNYGIIPQAPLIARCRQIDSCDL